jgi:hypothetical protein
LPSPPRQQAPEKFTGGFRNAIAKQQCRESAAPYRIGTSAVVWDIADQAHAFSAKQNWSAAAVGEPLSNVMKEGLPGRRSR